MLSGAFIVSLSSPDIGRIKWDEFVERTMKMGIHELVNVKTGSAALLLLFFLLSYILPLGARGLVV